MKTFYKYLTVASGFWIWLLLVGAVFWPVIVAAVFGVSNALVTLGFLHFTLVYHMYSISKAKGSLRSFLSGGTITDESVQQKIDLMQEEAYEAARRLSKPRFYVDPYERTTDNEESIAEANRSSEKPSEDQSDRATRH